MSAKFDISQGFTGNQLKVLAMIAMTCDHLGVMLFPNAVILRLIGRLALPIYAYMIAEGCRHTRSKGKYLLRLAGLGIACQIVYFVAMRSLYQCILITFSLSVCLICAIDYAQKKRDVMSRTLAQAAFFIICFVALGIPILFPETGFQVDYGIIGVLLPVLVYFGPDRQKYLTAGLILLGLGSGGIQWFSLAAVPLLGMYNGKRGTAKLGWLFYLYYPLHLAAIYGLSLIL